MLCKKKRVVPENPATWRGEIVDYVDGGSGIQLPLRRYVPEAEQKGTVMLVHGASASSDSFLIPQGGLMKYLTRKGWDVWTLDWRGSREVVSKLPPGFIGGSLKNECALFTVDEVASIDFPGALEKIKGRTRAKSISVVAHCFGSGCFSTAVARGHVESHGVEKVVLSTLGLFYEVPWNGWIKVEDFIIERMLGENPKVRAIDPTAGKAWPAAIAAAYKIWPKSWLPPDDWDPRTNDIFQRLSFMFGQPYLAEPGVLAEGIQGPLIAELFGGMHLGLYLHAGQMVRRGYSAKLDDLDVVDRPRLREAKASYPVPGDLNPRYFSDKKVTLIGGAQNQLWHRDSVDLMYEWLLRSSDPERKPVKHMFKDHAHQDLLWGADVAKADGVYAKIEAGL